MDPHSRLIATKWLVIALVLGLGIVNSPLLNGSQTLELPNVILNVLMLSFAVTCLGFVWNWGNLPSTTRPAETGVEREKAKRRERLDSLLDSLNDDELDALRQRLSTDDDQVELKALLKDDGELTRR